MNDFLKKKYDLHKSPEVESAARRKEKRTGEKVPQDPSSRIGNYLDRFREITDREDPQRREMGMDAIKSFLYDKYVIKSEDIPESYWEGLMQIARERGQGGDIEGVDLETLKEQNTEALIADQKSTLDMWVDYLASPDATYPDWLKYWAIRSVLKIGEYDKEKGAFTKRSTGTVSPFPDLNREALAYVLDAVEKKYEKKDVNLTGLDEEDRGELEGLLQKENFAKFYAWAVEKVTPASKEALKSTEGEWIKYDRGSDHMPLVESIQGHGTNWCTAGESTAESQLKGGDFYIYYSLNEDGEPTIPRVAIRMEEDGIAEVRGIADKDQNLDPYMNDVVQEKLKEFPDGEAYERKAQNMERLTSIEKGCKNGKELTAKDLGFLYEIDLKIEGFGYSRDPRIKEIKEERDVRKDYALIFDCDPDQVAMEEDEISDETVVFTGNLKVPSSWEKMPKKLVYIGGDANFRNSQVEDLGELETIGRDANFMDSQIENLGKLETIGGSADFGDSQIENLGKLETIGGDTYFRDSQIKDLGRLETIGGNANFAYSQVENLGKLETIGGEARFTDSQIEDLGELETIGGNVDFEGSRVKSLGGLRTIGGDAYFVDSQIEDFGKLETIGEDAHFGDSRIENLGKLETIGGDADFRDSQVKSLGDLRAIGGYAYFVGSRVKNLGGLRTIGGDTYFRDSQIKDLGRLETIGGSVYFKSSRVKSLGGLRTVGGNADFTDSQVEDLGKLETIGGEVHTDKNSSIDFSKIKHEGIVVY